MIDPTLARGMALAVVLALLAGCGRDQPAEVTATGDAGYADAAVDEAPPAAELAVRQAWTRAVPANAPVAAGYLSVINTTGVDDRVLAVHTDAAGRVEIHEMISAADGTMQMRELAEGLPVPAGISVDLRPGGLHLMFFGPDTDRWQPGQHIAATVVFEVAGERDVAFEVFAPGESPDGPSSMQAPMADDGHGHHHHHDDEEDPADAGG
jgi:periplasmic copper chaperone A